MNVGDLEELWRRTHVDDVETPQLWSTEEFVGWLSEAEVEACRRARLIVDSQTPYTTAVSTSGTSTTTSTARLCQLLLGSATEFYDLDPRVIYLRRVKLAGRSQPLKPMDYRDLDECRPGWEASTGSVSGYVRGLDSGKLRPYPIPTTAGTVGLLVVREPLEPLADPNDEPEIAARYHLALLDWVSYRAYMKKDTEALDPEAAAKHLGLFEAEFGTRKQSAALEEEWARNNLPFDGQDGSY